jgi:ubiquinone/menaquinone biosynthesis C-methylase UbiE
MEKIMPSLSFDRVAHLYDATRGYPEVVAQQIVQAIDQTARATPQTAFLEVGIGTGRIAFPLVSLGRTYTGVDISEKMVEQLEAKVRKDGWQEYEQAWGTSPDENVTHMPLVRRFTQHTKGASLRLVMADMTQLPFHDATFDAVVAVHVFHLVDGWRQAVQEVVRVLRPGGWFLHCWDEHGVSELKRVEEEWPRILQELGWQLSRPGAPSHSSVEDALREQGLQSEKSYVASWEITVTPRQVVEYVMQRMGSGTWGVPDDIFRTSSERLWRWANSYFGAKMDVEYRQVRRFVISKTHV